MSEDLNIKQVGAMVAIVTALEKVVKERKSELRGVLKDWLCEQNEMNGTDSVALSIGKTRVGKGILTKPSIGTYATGEYERYAYGAGDGTRTITIDATGLSDEQVDWFIEAASECGTSGTVDYKANKTFEKAIEIVGEHVISKDTGEMVPGTYVKPPQFRVTSIKPLEVAKAMNIAAQSDDPMALMSVAGLLEGTE